MHSHRALIKNNDSNELHYNIELKKNTIIQDSIQVVYENYVYKLIMRTFFDEFLHLLNVFSSIYGKNDILWWYGTYVIFTFVTL